MPLTLARTRHSRKWYRFFLLACALLAGCAGPKTQQPIFSTVRPGRLEWAGDLPVIHLHGTPYERGYQQGSLLRREVRASVKNILGFADGALGVPLAGKVIARRLLDRTWKKMEPFVPPQHLEEMEGLADGAGIPLRLVKRVHAVPDLTSVSCASFAAAGPATKDGRLIHLRNLDWAIQSGIQDYAALFVHHPVRGNAFVSAGWLGFVGVISGINDQGISVGEIGAETVDEDLKGIPMPFLLRLVLEEAGDLEKAVALVQGSPRTVGYNYLFADAKRRRAVALETTRSRCAVFWMGEEPADVPYGLRVPDTLFRADFALDREVRDKQVADKGDPDTPGLESPEGSTAYRVRYRKQAQLLEAHRGAIDVGLAIVIAQEIAPAGNIQSVVYAYPELWVSNSRGRQPAATGVYQRVDLERLFAGAGAEEKSTSPP